MAKSNSNKPLNFKKGGLHASLGIAPTKKIPMADFNAALEGKRGKLARKEAQFAKNVLKHK